MSAQKGKNIIKVILDSNALFVPIQFKIDIFAELSRLLNKNFEVILLSPVQHELEIISKKSTPKMRKKACYALKLAQMCTLMEVNEKMAKTTDDIILKIAQKWNSPVFTNDRQLRKKLRDINVPVIYVRQKARLEIDGVK